MRPRAVTVGLLSVVAGSIAGAARAQEPAEPTPAPQVVDGGVVFGRVDSATVRVFAVSGVEREQVRGRARMRVLGIPQAGHGSGFVVDARGVIVTAKHVVEGARHIAVRLPGPDGAVLPTTVVYTDETLDFAILLVSVSEPLPHVLPLPEAAPRLAVRQSVDAIGYPLDAERRQPQSSRGIISGALDDGHLQLGMDVNPGNSGGPLIDAQQRVIGVVVARADPAAGAQGIGLAVPIQPVHEAYRRALETGAMSRASRALAASPEQSARIALAVDGIVRLGGIGLLQEAADFVENPEQSERLDRLRALAAEATDPDLLALLAAYFWDAAQVMLERAGGGATPRAMPRGPAQQLAQELWRLAHELAAKARSTDPTVAERSPFIGHLAPPAATQVAWSRHRAGSEERPGQPQRPGARADEPVYRPFVFGGPLVGLAPDGNASGGLHLTVLAPFRKKDPTRRFRFDGFVGASLEGSRGGATGGRVFIGADLGVAIRLGARGGFAITAAWAPGFYRLRNIGGGGYASVVSAAGGHFTASFRIREVHFGFSFRVAAESSPDTPVAADAYVSAGFLVGYAL